MNVFHFCRYIAVSGHAARAKGALFCMSSSTISRIFSSRGSKVILVKAKGKSNHATDVYRATMEDDEIFIIHQETNPTCPVGSKMPHLLGGVYTKVQATMEDELSGFTIEQLVESGIVETKG